MNYRPNWYAISAITVPILAALAMAFLSTQDTRSYHQQARDATWIIECPTAKAPRECGSAVQIAKGVFLTAQHITALEDAGPFYLTKNGQRVRVSNVLYQGPETDVAMVVAPTECPCVPISDHAPIMDTDVFAVGYPLLFYRENSTIQEAIVTEGRLQERIAPAGDEPIRHPWYVTTVRISPGNSGGGLFQVMDGELRVIGVASAGPVYNPGPFAPIPPQLYFNLGLFATWDSIQEALFVVRAPARL